MLSLRPLPSSRRSAVADDPYGKNHLSCFSICSLRSLGTLRLNSLLLFVFILFVAIGYAVISMISQWSL